MAREVMCALEIGETPWKPSGPYTRPRMAMAVARDLIRYIGQLDLARTVLWCYLLWYGVIAIRYFDPSPEIWGASLGLSGIIGVALLLNAGWPSQRAGLSGWQKLRFFVMPFCVSSFAALVKGRGFVLVFSRDLRDLILGVAACSFLLLARVLCRRSGSP